MPSSILSAFTLALVVGAGWFYVGRRCPGRPLYLTLALSHLVGAAALGLGSTLGILVTDRPSLAWCALGLAAAAGLARRGRSRAIAGVTRTGLPLRDGSHSVSPLSPSGEGSAATSGQAGAAPPLTHWEWGLVLLVALGLVTAAARLALLPLDWDGWAIWQFKAKALVDGSLRRFLTSPDFSFAHPDYPLLIPSLTWWLSPFTFSSKIAQLSGFLFFLDLLAIFYAAARTRMSRPLAFTGLVVLVSWPLAMKHSVSGFADLALAAYVLALAVLLTEEDLWLAVPCLLGAVLTKNEGLFTLVGAVAATAALWLLPRPADTKGPRKNDSVGSASTSASQPLPRFDASPKPRPRWLPLLVTAGVGLFAVAAWSVVKRRWGLAADLLDASQWPRDLAGALLQRLPIVAIGFLRELLSFGPKYPGWGLFWPLAAVGLALAVWTRRRDTLVLWVIVSAHLAGMTAAYLLTPLDPALHLSRSLDRLLLQIAPTVLLATLTVIPPPRPEEGSRPA